MAQRHENLIAWQRADNLCVEIYGLTSRRFPSDERFGLTSQLRRASYSVPANIVEGFAYAGPVMKLRFLRTAAASLAELGYGIRLARRLDYLSKDEEKRVTESIRKAAAPLHGLINQVAIDATREEATRRANRGLPTTR